MKKLIRKKCLSGKNSYDNEGSAKDAADLGMRLRKDAPFLSPYFCLLCYEWHLTSRKKKNK